MTTVYTFRVPSGAAVDVTKRIDADPALGVTYRVTGTIDLSVIRRIVGDVFAELTLLVETGEDFLLEGGDALVLE